MLCQPKCLCQLQPVDWVLPSACVSVLLLQVLTFTAVVMPNQDLAFMGAIAWTAINLLMSNFMVRYQDIDQRWFSQLR